MQELSDSSSLYQDSGLLQAENSGAKELIAAQSGHTQDGITRQIIIKNLDPSLDEAILRKLLEQCGELQSNYMGSLQQGVASATYFDLRAAASAQQQLNGMILGNCQLEANFAKAPKSTPQLDQGILVVVNSNASFTNEQLQSMLEAQFGQIRSVANSALNKDHKLVEFYDVRHAAEAVRKLQTEVSTEKIPDLTAQATGLQQQQQQQQQQLQSQHTVSEDVTAQLRQAQQPSGGVVSGGQDSTDWKPFGGSSLGLAAGGSTPSSSTASLPLLHSHPSPMSLQYIHPSDSASSFVTPSSSYQASMSRVTDLLNAGFGVDGTPSGAHSFLSLPVVNEDTVATDPRVDTPQFAVPQLPSAQPQRRSLDSSLAAVRQQEALAASGALGQTGLLEQLAAAQQQVGYLGGLGGEGGILGSSQQAAHQIGAILQQLILQENMQQQQEAQMQWLQQGVGVPGSGGLRTASSMGAVGSQGGSSASLAGMAAGNTGGGDESQERIVRLLQQMSLGQSTQTPAPQAAPLMSQPPSLNNLSALAPHLLQSLPQAPNLSQTPTNLQQLLAQAYLANQNSRNPDTSALVQQVVGRAWQKTGDTNPQVVLAQLARDMQAQQAQQTQQTLGHANSAALIQALLYSNARSSLAGTGGATSAGLTVASQQQQQQQLLEQLGRISAGPQPRTRPPRPRPGPSHQPEHHKNVMFALDINKVQRGEDKRTTLMIKNIPNKYNQDMLLETINKYIQAGSYDFLYLPIDFKNQCNVGYAFINMTAPESIIPLYQHFHQRKWERFNSEKIAHISYARIQGRQALIDHFRNSSLMHEDPRFQPILLGVGDDGRVRPEALPAPPNRPSGIM